MRRVKCFAYPLNNKITHTNAVPTRCRNYSRGGRKQHRAIDLNDEKNADLVIARHLRQDHHTHAQSAHAPLVATHAPCARAPGARSRRRCTLPLPVVLGEGALLALARTNVVTPVASRRRLHNLAL